MSLLIISSFVSWCSRFSPCSSLLSSPGQLRPPALLPLLLLLLWHLGLRMARLVNIAAGFDIIPDQLACSAGSPALDLGRYSTVPNRPPDPSASIITGRSAPRQLSQKDRRRAYIMIDGGDYMLLLFLPGIRLT